LEQDRRSPRLATTADRTGSIAAGIAKLANCLVSLIGYRSGMSRSIIVKYVTPWAFRREREEQRRIAELRSRDGDNCRRCRRPIRFDLVRGHDKGPAIESIAAAPCGEPPALENLCLCHGRCNADSGDNTLEVTERMRRKSEVELFAKSRRVRKAG